MLLTDAGIAQSVEHFTRNEGVEGSSPFSSFAANRDSFWSGRVALWG